MRTHLLPHDQHLFQLWIGIERPISEMLRNFFIPGKVQMHLPRVSMGASCERLAVPADYHPRDEVPLIYVRRGMIHFGSATWATGDEAVGSVAIAPRIDGRGLGYPALIPASYVDVTLDPSASDGDACALRLRPASLSQNLYLGCTYKNDAFGDALSVTPLICPAGQDLAEFTHWQPLLIPVGPSPEKQNFDFLLRRDNGRLQAPSAPGTVKAEIIPVASRERVTRSAA